MILLRLSQLKSGPGFSKTEEEPTELLLARVPSKQGSASVGIQTRRSWASAADGAGLRRHSDDKAGSNGSDLPTGKSKSGTFHRAEKLEVDFSQAAMDTDMLVGDTVLRIRPRPRTEHCSPRRSEYMRADRQRGYAAACSFVQVNLQFILFTCRCTSCWLIAMLFRRSFGR